MDIKTSETGGKKQSKIARMDLVPWDVLIATKSLNYLSPGILYDLSVLYGIGALKYGDNNWRKGMPWSWNFAACLRHLTKHQMNFLIDSETNTPHLVNALFHVICLMYYTYAHVGTDDRQIFLDVSRDCFSHLNNKNNLYKAIIQFWVYTPKTLVDDLYWLNLSMIDIVTSYNNATIGKIPITSMTHDTEF